MSKTKEILEQINYLTNSLRYCKLEEDELEKVNQTYEFLSSVRANFLKKEAAKRYRLKHKNRLRAEYQANKSVLKAKKKYKALQGFRDWANS